MAYKIRPDVAKVVMTITNEINRGANDSTIHWGEVMGWLSGCNDLAYKITPVVHNRFQELLAERQHNMVGGSADFYYEPNAREGYFYPHDNASDKILDWSHGGMFVDSGGNLVDETGWAFAPYLYYNAGSPPTINYDFLR